MHIGYLREYFFFCVLSNLHLSLFSSSKNAIWFRLFSHSLILSICFIFAGPVVGSFHFVGSQSPQSILNVEKVLSFLCSIGICWTWGPFGRTCLLAGWAVLGVYTRFQCFEISAGMPCCIRGIYWVSVLWKIIRDAEKNYLSKGCVWVHAYSQKNSQ